MDDLKISHQDPVVVGKVIASLSTKYDKVGEMTVRRGKKYDYLRMTLDFFEDGKYIVATEEYLGRIPSRLHEDMNGLADIISSPTTQLSFTTPWEVTLMPTRCSEKA